MRDSDGVPEDIRIATTAFSDGLNAALDRFNDELHSIASSKGREPPTLDQNLVLTLAAPVIGLVREKESCEFLMAQAEMIGDCFDGLRLASRRWLCSLDLVGESLEGWLGESWETKTPEQIAADENIVKSNRLDRDRDIDEISGWRLRIRVLQIGFELLVSYVCRNSAESR
jgi:hypothetical protein